jgi:hypothetical protein
LGVSVVCLLTATRAPADGFAAAFLETGLGARGAGIGSAFAAVVDDASAPYWNPAGLVRAPGKGIATSVRPLSLDRRQSSISVTLNLRGEMAFGFTWLHASVGGLEERAASGVVVGEMDDSQNALYVAVGRRLGTRIALGGAMKILNHRVEVPSFIKAASGKGHGFDLGIQFHLTPQTILAATARNLKAEQSWKVPRGGQRVSTSNDILPTVLTMGVAHRLRGNLLLAADIHLSDRGYLNLGTEWEVNSTLTMRSGLNRLPGSDGGAGSIAAGLTLRPMRRKALQFHYTYAADELGAGSSNIFGLTSTF